MAERASIKDSSRSSSSAASRELVIAPPESAGSDISDGCSSVSSTFVITRTVKSGHATKEIFRTALSRDVADLNGGLRERIAALRRDLARTALPDTRRNASNAQQRGSGRAIHDQKKRPPWNARPVKSQPAKRQAASENAVKYSRAFYDEANDAATSAPEGPLNKRNVRLNSQPTGDHREASPVEPSNRDALIRMAYRQVLGGRSESNRVNSSRASSPSPVKPNSKCVDAVPSPSAPVTRPSVFDDNMMWSSEWVSANISSVPAETSGLEQRWEWLRWDCTDKDSDASFDS